MFTHSCPSPLSVVSFTSALFLSGYAIQQRTVRNLRAAIRPETSPQIFLPDRFRDDTTELEDGTIVMLDEFNRPVRIKSGRISIGKAEDPEELFNVADAASRLGHGYREEEQEEVEIVFEESVPEPHLEQRPTEQKVLALEEPEGMIVDTPVENGGDAQPQEEESKPDPVNMQPKPAPWEVLAEDLVEEEEAETTEEDGAKPMSRAERRRKIKEDIQKLAQGSKPIYYQRRLW